MGIKEYVQNNEKTFKDKKDIKYLFCEKKYSNKLIVTFPGFSSPGRPPEYNYIRTLMDCNCHKLYILDDYGPRGSYLLGENKDHSIEVSVVSLISHICKKYDIKLKNVILQGSSKGGYCALYFGIKYNFGYVIAGGPQINLGNYLLYVVPDVAEYIAGGKDENDIAYLNRFLYDLVDLPSKKFPKIFIHVGKGDHHYKGHILPFLKKLDEKIIDYEIDIPNYSSHTSISLYYPDYLLKTLHSIDNNLILLKPTILKTSIKSENGSLNITCEAVGANLKYACHLYKEKDIIEKSNYQDEDTFKFPINSKGTYRARVYVKENSHFNSKITDEIIIDINDFKLKPDTQKKFDIDIHGSCVSRDIFNFDKNNEILLGKYFARNSFVSTVNKPFNEEININISSPWQKRMVEIDLKKELFNQLSINPADHLLIDFIDERFALMKYKESIFTLSTELKNSNFLDDFKGDYIDKLDLKKSFWKKPMDDYLNNLIKIYKENRIIIHETYLVDSFSTKGGEIKDFPESNLNYNYKVNKILEEYYNYMKTKLPNAHVVNIIGNYNSSETHRWGISPVHYEDSYYKHALEIIKNILSNK